MSALLILLQLILIQPAMSQSANVQPVYQFTVEDIYGEPFELASLKGKKIMIVNTASKCGHTPQYADLQKLYDTYKDDGFVIIGFPANDFLRQEPGSNEQIAEFCERNYGVTFPMMAKISVKGDDMHPLYQYLTSQTQNGHSDNKVKWNFQKYLIGEEGYLEKVIEPGVKPLDDQVLQWIWE